MRAFRGFAGNTFTAEIDELYCIIVRVVLRPPRTVAILRDDVAINRNIVYARVHVKRFGKQKKKTRASQTDSSRTGTKLYDVLS